MDLKRFLTAAIISAVVPSFIISMMISPAAASEESDSILRTLFPYITNGLQPLRDNWSMPGDYVNDEKEAYDDASEKFGSPRSLSSYENRSYPKRMNRSLRSRTQTERWDQNGVNVNGLAIDIIENFSRRLAGGKKGSGGGKKGGKKGSAGGKKGSAGGKKGSGGGKKGSAGGKKGGKKGSTAAPIMSNPGTPTSRPTPTITAAPTTETAVPTITAAPSAGPTTLCATFNGRANCENNGCCFFTGNQCLPPDNISACSTWDMNQVSCTCPNRDDPCVFMSNVCSSAPTPAPSTV